MDEETINYNDAMNMMQVKLSLSLVLMRILIHLCLYKTKLNL